MSGNSCSSRAAGFPSYSAWRARALTQAGSSSHCLMCWLNKLFGRWSVLAVHVNTTRSFWSHDVARRVLMLKCLLIGSLGFESAR